MNTIKSIYNFLALTLRFLWSSTGFNKISIIKSFFVLHIKNQLSKVYPKLEPRLQILKYEFEFFNFEAFTYLYSEIFMQQLYFFEHKGSEPVIIDCGSNLGLSILYFKSLYPEAKIIGFEPNKKTFELLKKNIEKNNLQKVQVFNCAIADYDGLIDFFDDQNISGSLVAGIHSSRAAIEKTKVPCFSLNQFLNEKIDFLKMDIEGAEGICFKDIDSTSRIKNINKMIIECHHNIQVEKNLSNVLLVLEKNNFKYQVSAIERSPFTKISPEDIMIYATTDFLS